MYDGCQIKEGSVEVEYDCAGIFQGHGTSPRLSCGAKRKIRLFRLRKKIKVGKKKDCADNVENLEGGTQFCLSVVLYALPGITAGFARAV